MFVLTRFFSSMKTPLRRYITYIICFSLCTTSPGWNYLALSQEAVLPTEPISQGDDNEDPSSLLNHPLYKQITDLNEDCCEGLPTVIDNGDLKPLDEVIQGYQSVRASVESHLNKSVWQRLREYCPYESFFSQECISIAASLSELFSQEGSEESIDITNPENINTIIITYLDEYCGEDYAERCSFLQDIDLSSVAEDFILPPPLNAHEILTDRFKTALSQHLEAHCLDQQAEECSQIGKAFLHYLQRDCLNQQTEECSKVIESIRPFFFEDNIMFIGLALTIAYKIILTKIYLGETIDKIDFSPFALTVNQSAYKLTSNCREETDSLLSEFQELSGIVLMTRNDYRYQNGQCYYDIQFGPLLFEKTQLLVKTSEDSDESLIQLVFYLILAHYYENLLGIKVLKGEEFANMSPPDTSFLPQNSPFSMRTSVSERLFRERQENNLEQNFRVALRIAYRDLTSSGNISYDEMNDTSLTYDDLTRRGENTVRLKFFTDDFWDYLASELGTPIPGDLRESVDKTESSSELVISELNVLSSMTDASSENFYCMSCETQTLEDYRRRQLHKFLIRSVYRAHYNAIHPLFVENGNLALTSAMAEYHRPFVQYLSGEGQRPTTHLSLLENLEDLTDQWIERAIEIMKLSPQLLAQQGHQSYVEELIQAANRISSVNDDRLSIFALYQTVKHQEDFPESSAGASTDLDRVFLPNLSYTNARRLFNELLRGSFLLIGLTEEDIDPVFFENVERKIEVTYRVASESNLGESEEGEGSLGLTDEQVGRILFGQADDSEASTDENADPASSEEEADDSEASTDENADPVSSEEEADDSEASTDENADAVSSEEEESNSDDSTEEFVGIYEYLFGQADDSEASTDVNIDFIFAEDGSVFIEKQTDEDSADQVVSENLSDESAGEPIVLTIEQVRRFFEQVDDSEESANENTDSVSSEEESPSSHSASESVNDTSVNDTDVTDTSVTDTSSDEEFNEQIRRRTMTIVQKNAKEVIEPSPLRDAMNKINPPTFDNILWQKSAEQSIEAYKRYIEYLLTVGEDMGFFDESFISERDVAIRDTVLSRLDPPQRGVGCGYIQFPVFCGSDDQVYLDFYKEQQRIAILNRYRILSNRYSSERNPLLGVILDKKPLFEIIQDNCGPGMDQQACRSHVSELVMSALEKQEQELENGFQELISHLADEDPSEALQKVKFALEENTEGGSAFTGIGQILESDEFYRAQFDFHRQRLQEHLTPTEDEKFWQNYVYTPIDNLSWTIGLMIVPGAVRGLSGASAAVMGMGRVGSGARQISMHQFASRHSGSMLLTAVVASTFGTKMMRDINNYNNHVSPRTDFVEDLYYVSLSPQTRQLVDQAQLLMSEQLENDLFNEIMIVPGLIIAAVLGFGGFWAFRSWRSGKGLIKQVHALEDHFNRLGIEDFSQVWGNMEGVRGRVNSLRVAASSRREKALIDKSWKAISNFHRRKTKEAQRLMSMRRQLGSSDDITVPDAMVTYAESQHGNPAHWNSLRKAVQRQENLFGLHQYNHSNYPPIQSFFKYLQETL